MIRKHLSIQCSKRFEHPYINFCDFLYDHIEIPPLAFDVEIFTFFNDSFQNFASSLLVK
jgi:hypothetical protein